MSEYPFIHNLLVDTYQAGAECRFTDSELQEYIKNNTEEFEDWVYAERIKDLERQLSQQDSDYNDILIALKEEHEEEIKIVREVEYQAGYHDGQHEAFKEMDEAKKLKEQG